jgi:hypothetical protein
MAMNINPPPTENATSPTATDIAIRLNTFTEAAPRHRIKVTVNLSA